MPSLPNALPIGQRPIRVYFPCTGLGRQRRGFETFTEECAEALAGDSRLDLTVFGGGSTADTKVNVVANLPRDSRGAEWLAMLHGRGAYFSEQLTFFMGFLPHLIGGRPDVVYFADLNLGNLCWHWRRLTGQRYRLLFYNGGLTTKPFTRADLVQQLTPLGMAEALSRGEREEQQVLLPHGVKIEPVLQSPLSGAARAALGLPVDRPIALSVGLRDASVKRMDYLIREIASLPEPRPFLVILGAESSETPAIEELGRQLLGESGVLFRTVERKAMHSYYLAADAFALASVREGFGLAYVEALAHGLPVIAHDFEVTRYLLGELGTLVDMTRAGALAAALRSALEQPLAKDARAQRHRSARNRFSWDMLSEQYVAMLQRAAGLGVQVAS